MPGLTEPQHATFYMEYLRLHLVPPASCTLNVSVPTKVRRRVLFREGSWDIACVLCSLHTPARAMYSLVDGDERRSIG